METTTADLILFAMGTGAKLYRQATPGSWRVVVTLGPGLRVEGFGSRPWAAMQDAFVKASNVPLDIG